MSSKQAAVDEFKQVLRTFFGAFMQLGLFSFFINLIMLVPPLYMLQVYDRVMTSRSESTLLMLTLIVVFLFATMGLLEWVRSRVLVRIGTRLDADLNPRMLDAAFRLSLRSPSQSGPQPLEDLTQIRQFLSGPAMLAFFDSPWVPIYLAALYIFHTAYGVFATFAAVILFVLALANEWVTKKPLSAASDQAMSARAALTSNLRNAEVVHALGMGGVLSRRWRKAHHESLSLQAAASDQAGVFMNLSKVLRLLFQSLMLGLGGYLAINLEVTAGMIIAGSIIMGRALAPIDQLIAGWKQFSTARSAYARLKGLLKEFPPLDERLALPPPTGRLNVEAIVQTAPGTQQVIIRGVSFALAAGESLCIIGPSGAGKSTLARAVLGVWSPVAGKVRLDGAEMQQWNRDELGPYIGYLPQDIELFSGTVAENICRFGELDSKRIIEAANLAGVHEMILHLPEGYDTPINQTGGVLSGGQRQRLGLARAVYALPKLIVLDEPNSNLDDAGEAALLNALDQLKRAASTVLIISHRANILAKVDKVLLLREGTVQQFGPRDEVLRALTPQAQPAAPRAAPRPRPRVQLTSPQAEG